MVDRIVPRTAPEDIERVRGEFGYTDEALVVCEPFRQWVMEDQFMGPRPAWEAAGAELVGDVAPYEQAKLRLLNASHSLLAYLGLLLGYEFIHEVIGDADLANFARRVLVDEVVPTIDLPSGFDLAGYIDATLERFANTAVAYRAAQVASDGSHKLVQRIYPTLRARVERGLPAPGMELAVCAWLQCLTGRAEDGTAIGFDDPGAKPVGRLVATHHDPRALVDAIDQDTNHWDSVQAQHRDELRKRLANSLQALRQQGVHGRINALMATPAQPALSLQLVAKVASGSLGGRNQVCTHGGSRSLGIVRLQRLEDILVLIHHRVDPLFDDQLVELAGETRLAAQCPQPLDGVHDGSILGASSDCQVKAAIHLFDQRRLIGTAHLLKRLSQRTELARRHSFSCQRGGFGLHDET